VSTDRRILLWGLIVEQARGDPIRVEHVAVAAAVATGVDCSAITVILPASPRETVYTSNQMAADVEELSMTLGEGPGVDALAGNLTLAANLDDAQSRTRWPMFTSAAVSSGVHAAFALPLQVGSINLGAMDLYRAEPGALDQDQVADALLLADTACALLLDAARFQPGDADGDMPEAASLQHPEVHQATGMIIGQLGVTATVALIRLRAYAYAHDRRLRDVAADVVARRLRFHPDANAANDTDEA
jgi:transcriptional regulator with GAF, ATPase, and Fis domain